MSQNSQNMWGFCVLLAVCWVLSQGMLLLLVQQDVKFDLCLVEPQMSSAWLFARWACCATLTGRLEVRLLCCAVTWCCHQMFQCFYSSLRVLTACQRSGILWRLEPNLCQNIDSQPNYGYLLYNEFPSLFFRLIRQIIFWMFSSWSKRCYHSIHNWIFLQTLLLKSVLQ